MTHIVIHENRSIRESYLLSLLEKLLGKKFKDLEAAKINPDVHILQTDGSIGIEAVKGLQKEMVFRPFQEDVQIAVIADAHGLTVEAQNALLKTLEEQPGATEYILLVNNEKNLLDTITSRGVKHYVKSEQKAVKVGEAVKPKILDMDLVDGFSEVERVIKEGEIDQLVDSLLRYLRDQMGKSLRENNNAGKYKQQIERVMQAKTRLEANGNKKLVLENMILQITQD